MPSNGIYPPEIENVVPVFQVSSFKEGNRTKYQGSFDVEYSMSQFNKIDFSYNVIQCSICYQKGGASAVVKQNNEAQNRYRQTGSIILTFDERRKGDGNFTISNDDLFNNTWEIGALYKIQIRVGNILDPDELAEDVIASDQTKWLNEHNKEFSEWSTVFVIKPIDKIQIKIPILKYDSLQMEQVTDGTIHESTCHGSILDFYGFYEFESGQYLENLYSYQVILYDANNNKLEDSGLIYATELNKFRYLFHTELEQDKKYKLSFTYTTENGFTLPENKLITINILCTYNKRYGTLEDNLILVIPDILDDPIDGKSRKDILNSMLGKDNNFPFDTFTVEKDNEEGRIAIKLCNKYNHTIYSGNLILVRSDNRSNYTYWEDIKIINVVQQDINTLDIIYDYTVESGVIYTYGIQEVIFTNKSGDYNRTGVYGKIQYEGVRGINSPIMREFEHSFLLGENGQQLKLKYNNTMDSLKININTVKIDTLGSKYPFIMKNGDTEYKSFPVKGLISFNMDDSYLFATPYDIYNHKAIFRGENAKNDIVDQYRWYNSIHYGYGEKVLVDKDEDGKLDIFSMESKYMQYDTIYEKLFREKVLEFLQNGKPKLFKSPTEGNIIIQLMDINLSPHQELNRLLYSFSANAIEVDEATMLKYLEYKLYDIGQIITDFSVREVKIGQLKGTFTTKDNLIDLIMKKYDLSNYNIAGYKIMVDEIFDVQIEFNSEPYLIQDGSNKDLKIFMEKNRPIIGYEMELKLNKNINNIKITNFSRTYVFDEIIRIDTENQNEKNNSLKIKSAKNRTDIDEEKSPQIFDITINFLYTMVKKPYEEKYLDKIEIKPAVGQIYQNISKNTSLTNLIKNKCMFYQNIIETYDTIEKEKQQRERYISEEIKQFKSISLEAEPGSQFAIYDTNEYVEQIFVVGPTGILNIGSVFDIDRVVYKGPYDNIDVLMDYYYVIERGEWLNVEN